MRQQNTMEPWYAVSSSQHATGHAHGTLEGAQVRLDPLI